MITWLTSSEYRGNSPKKCGRGCCQGVASEKRAFGGVCHAAPASCRASCGFGEEVTSPTSSASSGSAESVLRAVMAAVGATGALSIWKNFAVSYTCRSLQWASGSREGVRATFTRQFWVKQVV